jgi:hypothetical protein
MPEFGELRPYRFFSLAAHGRWYQQLSRHGGVDLFETSPVGGADGWEYQLAVLRAPVSTGAAGGTVNSTA